MDNDLAVEMWGMFLGMEEIEPAALGARDTLRTEVGYNLSGQDFDASWTPLESAMESFIAWDTNFVGKAALERRRASGDYKRLVGIVTHTKQKPQHGFEVKHNGAVVGEVTSGTYGPTVGHGVGLARVPAKLSAPGTKLTAGPRDLEIEVTPPPFYKDGTCRMNVGAAAKA
jgi:aminomethyltransferase